MPPQKRTRPRRIRNSRNKTDASPARLRFAGARLILCLRASHSEQAAVVCRIFVDCAASYSLRTVAKELGRTFGWCRGPESNWLRPPFQGGALPLSYPGMWLIKCRGGGELCQIIAAIRAIISLAMAGGDDYSWASSYSFIQARDLRSSRGLVPSGGPTMPSFSIRSMRRAARP